MFFVSIAFVLDFTSRARDVGQWLGHLDQVGSRVAERSSEQLFPAEMAG